MDPMQLAMYNGSEELWTGIVPAATEIALKSSGQYLSLSIGDNLVYNEQVNKGFDEDENDLEYLAYVEKEAERAENFTTSDQITDASEETGEDNDDGFSDDMPF